METKISVRKGMPSVQLSKEEFRQRYLDRFFDPLFEANKPELDAIVENAWTAYDDYHKNPRKVRAGPGFSKPDAELPVEWLDTRRKIEAAQREHQSPQSKSSILIVNGSSRSDQSCPGEMSKTWRLAMLAKEIVDKEPGFEVEFLDLSRLTSEYGRVIYPCKACVSTAMPLCHWPCSCYPNYAMGQVNDWMSSIYPMWMRAHGIMIVTPVNWYQAPSSLKLMIDRLVCADGGNPDPTTTDGKNPQKAKEIELRGWSYPRHLGGRLFSVVVHGDATGVETLRRVLTEWLTDIGMIPAGRKATIGSYVGYYRPYATSHEDLDEDSAFQGEVQNAARSLVVAVRLQRSGRLDQPDEGLEDLRPK
jgi:multimeric flavodoxin WrbA